MIYDKATQEFLSLYISPEQRVYTPPVTEDKDGNLATARHLEEVRTHGGGLLTELANTLFFG